MSSIIKVDEAYRNWIAEISKRFRQCQIRAAVKTNDEMLRLYWTLGSDMEERKSAYEWGSHFYSQISKDLLKELPEVGSFSPRNLLYMHQFYRLFPDALIAKQAVSQLESREIVKQAVSQIDDRELVFLVPWGHMVQIINKCKEDESKALFYVKKTLENNWSRAVLLNFLGTDLYERQGKAVTNFRLTLPEDQSDLAQQMTRDPYCFDFLTLQQKYNEKELKDALMNKAEKFLMELGTGFALMGREVRLEVGDTEKYLDMLFYNTRRHCYVVVEVKAVDFDSSFAGQLGTYVVAVNHQIKTELDNPTIGLLICKGMDKVEAQYALESTSQPLGISSYELSKLVPDDFKGSMPTIEEIEAELSDAIVDSEKKGGQDA